MTRPAPRMVVAIPWLINVADYKEGIARLI